MTFLLLGFVIKNVQDLLTREQTHKNYEQDSILLPAFVYTLNLQHFKKWYEQEVYYPPRFTKTENKDKGSVIVFGCSFARGCFLEDNQTFGYKLSKKSNRTVYNIGFSGFGLGAMLWTARNESFYQKIIDTKPDYVIYIFIMDHVRRIYEEKYGYNFSKTYINYKAKENHLIEETPLYIQVNRLFIANRISAKLTNDYILSLDNKDKNFDLMKLYFEETKQAINNRYPNTKFIIIKHPFMLKNSCSSPELGYFYTSERWKELEDEGFIIYDLKERIKNVDFEDDEYTFPDGHPNEKAWDIVIEKIIKDLKL